MEQKKDLIDIARIVIAETCVSVDLSKSKPVYLPIKDNKIKVSLKMNSIKNADECLLYLPYIWYNTVPNRYGPGTVTFGNNMRKLVHIDHEGNIDELGYRKDYPLNIDVVCYTFGANIYFQIKYGYRTLWEKNNISTVQEFHNMWNMYQNYKKIMNMMKEDFDREKAALNSQIEELENKYKDIKKKNSNLRKRITNLKKQA